MASTTDSHHHERPAGTSVPSPARPQAGGSFDYSLLFLVIATVAFVVARIPIIPHRIFDPDELQHVHGAWCLFRGMTPYKDFFEHHTPWYYFTLRPFFHWFSVDTSFESARRFLVFGRGVSLLLTVLSVVVIAAVGSRCRDRKTGLLAGLFLVGQPVFFEKTLEMRPDVLALPFFLGALWFLLHGLDHAAGSTSRRHRRFLAAGLALGAAIMCTQKMLFVLPGLLGSLGLWALFASRPSGGSLRSRVLSVLAFLAGMAVPALLTWAVFALRGAGGDFIANNFLLNARWHTTVGEQLLKLLVSSWPILLLGLLGAVVSCYQFVHAQQRRYGEPVLLGTFLGLVAGILVVPVAHRQYYLMLLPIVCLFAAQGLRFLVDLADRRTQPWLLVVATLPLSILPVLDLREALTTGNQEQLARLEYVLKVTGPTDLVMDGWEGTGVFRPHAFHYFFLHDELLDMLPRERLDAFLDAFESGSVRPRLIALDEQLVRLGSRFVRVVKTHYTTDDGFFYLHRPRRSGVVQSPPSMPPS